MPEPSRDTLLRTARAVVGTEAEALRRLLEGLDESFLDAAELLFGCRGRVVVIGMGKSGIIGRKISATFASTGTPSLFLHPAEAAHGDLGMVRAGDVVLALSASGETEEILKLLPFLRLMAITIVAIVRRTDSTLARHADRLLAVAVESEGCPLDLAPMASTTAMLALGDALAAVLMEKRAFRPEDFALYHPDGSLGRRLLTTVRDLMISGHHLPVAEPRDPMRAVLHVMIEKNLGAVLAVGPGGALEGILTDGDLKRLIESRRDFFDVLLADAMSRTPTTIAPDALAEAALRVMEDNSRRQITVLPVVDSAGKAIGLIRMHDILKAKIR
ncbi:MAG: KpsF/GutQ family sugar-phosphate isomerase [Candidatus Wallbacteria bacterium]|nr:KpsF/GutQ family sugar-phosphate isomerase [Candidatus Wallbacteria bacterium]